MRRSPRRYARVAGADAAPGTEAGPWDPLTRPPLPPFPSRAWARARVGLLLRGLLWTVLRAWAEDITAASSRASALVLAPHADDETLGCAVTIMRKTDAGSPVTVVIATDGRYSSRSNVLAGADLVALRETETRSACSILGVPPDAVHFLGFEDTRLAEHSRDLERRLTTLVAALDPDEVYVTSAREPHPDHQALGEAARRLVAGGVIRGNVYEYPVWLWRSWRWLESETELPSGSWAARIRAVVRRRPAIVDTSGRLARKAEALVAYQSQTANLTGEAQYWRLDERFIANFFRSHEVFFPVSDVQPDSRRGWLSKGWRGCATVSTVDRQRTGRWVPRRFQRSEPLASVRGGSTPQSLQETQDDSSG